MAYSSARRTGSFVVMRVVEVVSWMVLVWAPIAARRVVGELLKKGGLWCSPIAKTSRPTSSAFLAIFTIASIRSASLGV